MATLLRMLLVLPLLLLAHAPPAEAQAQTRECRARVEHAGNVLQGKRVYSRWLIGHTPLRWATVSFRYRLTYLDEANQENRIEGSFRQHISGREEEYVELKNLRRRPTFVTKTDITDITCSP